MSNYFNYDRDTRIAIFNTNKAQSEEHWYSKQENTHSNLYNVIGTCGLDTKKQTISDIKQQKW
jgi:hypothetical protein